MNNKIIIFDFDGVLIDSTEAVIRIIRKMAGFSLNKEERKMADWDIDHFRNLSSDELYFKFPKWKIAIAVLYGRRKISQYIKNIEPIEGIREELLKLKRAGYTMGIASSNSYENIVTFLRVNEMEIFDFVYSGSVFLKKEKKLKKILCAHNFDSRDVVFVADETRDIDAARKNNLKIIAVSWGNTNKDVLRRYNPDYIIDKPEELSPLINQIYGKN